MLIISIVPRLPPAIDGVGDYALNLASQLRKDFAIETHFLVCDPNWTGAKNIEGFAVSKLTVRSASKLLSLLSPDISTVLLHYVGYGYNKRGCPVWLVKGLERWKSSITNARLVTMFHEISASGPIWTSAFWLSRLQITLATRLVQLSDRCLTSKQFYAEILHKLSRGQHKEILAMPVFSSIAEPQQVLPLAERQRHLVVFGGSRNRLQVYQNSSAMLNRTCELLGIEKILDIGPPVNLNLSSFKSVPIVEMGKQPAAKISEILLNSQVGFLNYNPDYLAKSTIFAAYCAHGLLTVSAHCSTLPIDGIEPEKHYWLSDEQTAECKSGAELQAIANNAYAWYQSHNLSVQAQTFAQFLIKSSPTVVGQKL
ncbi:glycosyltransferase family 1 protein [Tolypothrix campylonemoides VB511288]|nr:glycosyltransferase family 1 protein [Tolypothrix campylonemoides VB511288]